MEKLLLELWQNRNTKITLYILLTLIYFCFNVGAITLLFLLPLVIKYLIDKPSNVSFASIFKIKDLVYLFFCMAVVTALVGQLESIIENKLLDRKSELEKDITSKYFTNGNLQIKFIASEIDEVRKEFETNEYLNLQIKNAEVTSCISNVTNFGIVYGYQNSSADFSLKKKSGNFILDKHNNLDSFYYFKLVFSSNKQKVIDENAGTFTAHTLFIILLPTNISINKIEPSDNFWENVYKLYKYKDTYKGFSFANDNVFKSVIGLNRFFSKSFYTNDNWKLALETIYYFDMLVTPLNSSSDNEVSTEPIRVDNYEQIVTEEQNEYNQSQIVVDTQSN